MAVLKDQCGILIRWTEFSFMLWIEFWITYRRKFLDFDEFIVIRVILQIQVH